MKGLLIKDIKIIISQKKFFIMAIFLAAVFAWTTEDVTFSASYIVLLLSMLTLTTLSYDEANGGMLFLLTLPATRKTYVNSKYTFALLNLVFASVFAFALCYVFAMIKGTALPLDDVISSIMGIMVAMGIMLSVTIPLELKYGAEKGRIAMLASIAVIVVLGIGVYKLLTEVIKVDVEGILLKLLERLPAVGNGLEILIVGVLLVILLLIFFVSYCVSGKIIKKKEF